MNLVSFAAAIFAFSWSMAFGAEPDSGRGVANYWLDTNDSSAHLLLAGDHTRPISLTVYQDEENCKTLVLSGHLINRFSCRMTLDECSANHPINVSVSSLISTEIAGPPREMEVERRLTSFLQNARKIRFQKEKSSGSYVGGSVLTIYSSIDGKEFGVRFTSMKDAALNSFLEQLLNRTYIFDMSDPTTLATLDLSDIANGEVVAGEEGNSRRNHPQLLQHRRYYLYFLNDGKQQPEAARPENETRIAVALRIFNRMHSWIDVYEVKSDGTAHVQFSRPEITRMYPFLKVDRIVERALNDFLPQIANLVVKDEGSTLFLVGSSDQAAKLVEVPAQSHFDRPSNVVII